MKLGDKCKIVNVPYGVSQNKIGRTGEIIKIDEEDKDGLPIKFMDENGMSWWLHESHLELI